MLVRRCPPSRRVAHGFTLIELVVTIAIMAILVAVALPSFRQFVANQRLRNASFDLMASLQRTRNEAITRNANISMTKKTTPGSWDLGWVIKDGTAANNTLLEQQAYSGLTITNPTSPASANLDTVTYGKDGRAVSAATSFTVAPSPAITGVTSRCITISLSGVPSSSTGACP